MNKLHQQAIELKYEGKTYQEISDLLDGKFTLGTLKKYFAYDGVLHLPYLEYEAEHNQWNEQEIRKEFQRMTMYSAKIMKDLLQGSLVSHDFRLTLKILKEIMDRAGITVQRMSEAQMEEEAMDTSEEAIDQRLREAGIDPDSIRYISTIPSITK